MHQPHGIQHKNNNLNSLFLSIYRDLTKCVHISLLPYIFISYIHAREVKFTRLFAYSNSIRTLFFLFLIKENSNFKIDILDKTKRI